MTPETPTPETDDHSDRMDNEDFDVELALTYDLARRLERERDAARAENEAMRAAIREAYISLEWATRTMNPPFEWEPFTRANDALAKLQPFITNATPFKP